MKEMIIIRGLPSSGKSSLAKILASASPNSVAICSADQYFNNGGAYKFDKDCLKDAHAYCKHKAHYECTNGTQLVIIDNTNTTKKEYQYYVDIANHFGYNVRSIIVETTHSNKNDHNVPDETVQKMKRRFKVNL